VTIADIVAQLREWQGQRRNVVKTQNMLNNRAGAMARRALGWRHDLTEKERKANITLGAKCVKAIIKGEPLPDECADMDPLRRDGMIAFVLGTKTACEPFDAMRKVAEKAMRGLARDLPVWPWAEGVRGFGDLGLAIIIGEAGDLSIYAGPAKVWKRFGLAPGQRKHKDKEKAIEAGYSPQRRSSMWTIGDSLIKGNDDGYRSLYVEVKATLLAREGDDKPKSQMHAHRMAQARMEKRLLRNLWRAWRDTSKQGVLV